MQPPWIETAASHPDGFPWYSCSIKFVYDHTNSFSRALSNVYESWLKMKLSEWSRAEEKLAPQAAELPIPAARGISLSRVTSIVPPLIAVSWELLFTSCFYTSFAMCSKSLYSLIAVGYPSWGGSVDSILLTQESSLLSMDKTASSTGVLSPSCST